MLETGMTPQPLVGPIRIVINRLNVDVSEIATLNEGKLAEFRASGLDLKGCRVSVPELQLDDAQYDLIREGSLLIVSQQVAAAKAEAAFQVLGRSVLVEDTALWVDACPLVTGPLIKGWTQAPRDGDQDGLLQLCMLSAIANNRNATAICTLGVSDGKNHVTWSGTVQGHIAESPRGDHGFGWDKIFIPEPGMQFARFGNSKLMTWAEMEPDQKLKIFPFRGAAIDELRKSVQ